jgi:hypothetical protein
LTIVGPPDPEFWQGDLFADVPWAYVRDLDFVEAANPGFRLSGLPTLGHRARLVTHAGRSMGMLVTHECTVDKGQETPLAFARVFPLSSQRRTQFQDRIRAGEIVSSFYLPAATGLIEESYADFRFITSIDPRHLRDLTRVASLDNEGRAAFKEQFIRFWTRVELNVPSESEAAPPGSETEGAQ